MFTIILYGFDMICMELTRTDAVFSRTTVVLFLCWNESSPYELKLFDDFFRTKETPEASWEGQKSYEEGTTHQGAPGGPGLPGGMCLPRGPSSRDTDGKKSYK